MGAAQVILCVANFLTLVIGFALLGTGVFTKFFANHLIIKALEESQKNKTDNDTKTDGNEKIELPVVGSIGTWLITCGVIISLASLIGCYTCCVDKCIYPYVGAVFLVLIAINTYTAMAFDRESSLHDSWRDEFLTQLQEKYEPFNISNKEKPNSYSAVIMLMHRMFNCCGVKEGYKDFPKTESGDTVIPSICCRREILDFDKNKKTQVNKTLEASFERCLKQGNPDPTDIYTEPCYNKMRDLALDKADKIGGKTVLLAPINVLVMLDFVLAIVVLSERMQAGEAEKEKAAAAAAETEAAAQTEAEAVAESPASESDVKVSPAESESGSVKSGTSEESIRSSTSVDSVESAGGSESDES